MCRWRSVRCSATPTAIKTAATQKDVSGASPSNAKAAATQRFTAPAARPLMPAILTESPAEILRVRLLSSAQHKQAPATASAGQEGREHAFEVQKERYRRGGARGKGEHQERRADDAPRNDGTGEPLVVARREPGPLGRPP